MTSLGRRLRSGIPGALALIVMTAGLARAGEPDRAAVVESYRKAAGFLAGIQNKNGSWGEVPGSKEKGEIGLTALVLQGLSHAPAAIRKPHEEALGKAATWIREHQQKSGAITQDKSGLTTYRTALSMLALQAHDAKAHKEVIARAQKWLVDAQFTESDKVSSDNPHYGGWGYGKKGEKPDADMSNTAFALQALKASGLSEDDPAFKRALEFVTRCQNNSETNKGVGKLRAKDDGGFFYDPGLSRNKSQSSENKDGTVSFESYAGMTYAGLMSLIHAGSSKDDPRVKAALRWIHDHYTLETNYGLGIRNPKPNADKQGLYYYYLAFAKCCDLLGSPTLETKDGKKNWAKDLATKLLAEQKPGGFWINEASERWWEGNPLVPTAFMVNALPRILKAMPEKK